MVQGGPAIVRGTIIGQTVPLDIHIEEGRIVSIAPVGRRPATMGTVTTHIGPTLLDIQVNGAGGTDLQGDRVRPEDVAKVGQWLARGGVSHWIPTLITGAPADLEHGCRVFADALTDPALTRAIPGIHLEGPYISPVDGPRGAHPKRYVRPPDLREFDRLMKAANGKIVYITLAPELPGAIPFIRGVVKRGVAASLGHHHAGGDDVKRAVDAGARLSTHLGNGLAATINRHANPLWPQLADDRLTAALIADLEHLPAPVLKTFVRAKTPDRVILTSDCVHVAGLKPGRYRLAGHEVELTRQGRVNLVGTAFLAGSALMLLQGVVNAVQSTEMTLDQAFASATTIPAAILGLGALANPIEVGRKADLLVFDIDRSKTHWKARVQAVFVQGDRRA